jgi:GT2 family glycosyltransferase
MLTYSVVICTLDRPEDLKRCITSWLSQKPLPHDIVVVHGKPEGILEGELQKLFEGTGVELCYIRMLPSLVRQRNAGIQQALGDVVFFADDDAAYMGGYAQAILDVYEKDVSGKIGGVQGTIANFTPSQVDRWGLARLFMLPRLGNGRLQPSAWPSYYSLDHNLAQVEVFSGPAMSYRKEVLQKFQFNEALARYWVGDDFEMAYRVSREYKLIQVLDARLFHYVSPAGRDSERRLTKMTVVNHFYLTQQFFGRAWKSWFFWGWSEFWLWIIALSWLLTGRGAERLLGVFDGYRELLDFSAQKDRRQASNRENLIEE